MAVTKNAPASDRSQVTTSTNFHYLPSVDSDLFCVRVGVPLSLALEEATCMVDAAKETARRVACTISGDDGAHSLWSAVYALSMAHGLLESVQTALESESGYATTGTRDAA